MKNLLIDILGENYCKIEQARDDNGKVWYRAIDVCVVLGLKNTSHSVRGNVRIGYIGIERLDVKQFGPHEKSPLYLSEAGLYKLILKSRKPAAYQIKCKLSLEILPEIMKNGSFEESRADNYPEPEISLEEVIRCKRCKCSKG
jgi:anti-repressor protein